MKGDLPPNEREVERDSKGELERGSLGREAVDGTTTTMATTMRVGIASLGAPCTRRGRTKQKRGSTKKVRAKETDRPGEEPIEDKDVGTRGWSLSASRYQEAKEDTAASTKGGLAALLVLATIGGGTYLSARAMRNHVERNAMRAPAAGVETSVSEGNRDTTKHDEPRLPDVGMANSDGDGTAEASEDVQQIEETEWRSEREETGVENEEEEGKSAWKVPETTTVEVEVDLSEAQAAFVRTLEKAAGANAAAAEAARTAGEAASASVEAAQVATRLHVAIMEGAETAIEDAILVAERAAKRAEVAESRAHAAAESAKKAAEETRLQANTSRGMKVTPSEPAKVEKSAENDTWIHHTSRSWARNFKSSTQNLKEKAGKAAQATKNRIWLLMPSSKEKK